MLSGCCSSACRNHHTLAVIHYTPMLICLYWFSLSWILSKLGISWSNLWPTSHPSYPHSIFSCQNTRYYILNLCFQCSLSGGLKEMWTQVWKWGSWTSAEWSSLLLSETCTHKTETLQSFSLYQNEVFTLRNALETESKNLTFWYFFLSQCVNIGDTIGSLSLSLCYKGLNYKYNPQFNFVC